MKYLCVGGKYHGKMVHIPKRPLRATIGGEAYIHISRVVVNARPLHNNLVPQFQFYLLYTLHTGPKGDESLLSDALILASGTELIRADKSGCYGADAIVEKE